MITYKQFIYNLDMYNLIVCKQMTGIRLLVLLTVVSLKGIQSGKVVLEWKGIVGMFIE